MNFVMNSYVDKKYINLVSPTLDRFKWKKDNLANCRCPLCGDSQKNQNKCRGFFYEVKGKYNYKCHNCGASVSLSRFLEMHSPTLHSQYRLERYRSAPQESSSITTGVNDMFFKQKENTPRDNFKHMVCVADLDSDHVARVFCEHRKIPRKMYKHLYYAKEWSKVAKSIDPEIRSLDFDQRLVIPFFDKKGNVVAAQGRTLELRSMTGSADREGFTKGGCRYLTVKSNKDPERLWYGQWRADSSKRVYVVEGPIDSLFLDNAVAMVGAGGVGSIPDHLKNSDLVFVLDNEPRNRQIANLMERLLEIGHKVCIWPRSNEFKDVNDMILGGMTKREIQKQIDANTHMRLSGTLALGRWRVGE